MLEGKSVYRKSDNGNSAFANINTSMEINVHKHEHLQRSNKKKCKREKIQSSIN